MRSSRARTRTCGPEIVVEEEIVVGGGFGTGLTVDSLFFGVDRVIYVEVLIANADGDPEPEPDPEPESGMKVDAAASGCRGVGSVAALWKS